MFIIDAYTIRTPLVEYVVREGDTLSKLSRLTGESVATIAERNNIADPNRITTGQKIVINDPIKACDLEKDCYNGVKRSDGYMSNCYERANAFKLLHEYVSSLDRTVSVTLASVLNQSE